MLQFKLYIKLHVFYSLICMQGAARSHDRNGSSSSCDKICRHVHVQLGLSKALLEWKIKDSWNQLPHSHPLYIHHCSSGNEISQMNHSQTINTETHTLHSFSLLHIRVTQWFISLTHAFYMHPSPCYTIFRQWFVMKVEKLEIWNTAAQLWGVISIPTKTLSLIILELF